MARRRQAVTIKHVAADAGVSLQTVSRVINNEPNVRPAMKEKVQASIDKLGYVPSIAAQRMSGSRSYLILALNDRERTIADWRELALVSAKLRRSGDHARDLEMLDKRAWPAMEHYQRQ